MKVRTPNTNISSGSINASFIKDGAVTRDKIADGSINAAKIEDGTVIAQELASDSVTTIKILDDAITTAKILDANVTTSKIDDGSITTVKILDLNITTPKILDSAVTEAKIGALAVTDAKLASDSVITAKILDANITSAKIASLQVLSNHIATDQVRSWHILDGDVTGTKIADGNVTTAKIADDAITLAKLNTTGATDNQILVYDAATTSVVWETPATQYSDADAVDAWEAAASITSTTNNKDLNFTHSITRGTDGYVYINSDEVWLGGAKGIVIEDDQISSWGGGSYLTLGGPNSGANPIKVDGYIEFNQTTHGLATTTFNQPVTFNESIVVDNLSSAPTGVAGQIYFDTTDDKFKGHDGTSWSNLDGT